MSRRVAVIRFQDGHIMYGLYETITDGLFEPLWVEEVEALKALNNPSASYRKYDLPITDEEPVEVLPYALNGDNTIYFCSRASRIAGAITGPRSNADVIDEIRAQEY